MFPVHRFSPFPFLYHIYVNVPLPKGFPVSDRVFTGPLVTILL